MTSVLVVYDRSAGQLLREQSFDDRREALAARFAEERRHRRRPNIEVVVLGAETRQDLLRTHGRYFL